jgi:hypothetical protein
MTAMLSPLATDGLLLRRYSKADAAFDHLGLNRLERIIAANSTAGRRVAEKLGAAHEGTLHKRPVLPAGPTDMAM